MSRRPFGQSHTAKPNLPRHGIARALSKLGYCSRSHATELIRAGRVQINGVVRKDPEFPVRFEADKLLVDGRPIQIEDRVYLMLNKPRGLVTTASDEKGRPTVFQCLDSHNLPHLSPVGRLDQASEGLLLFSNDTTWADGITDPQTHCEKCYHVQVNQIYHPRWKTQAEAGLMVEGERLRASQLDLLRQGGKNCWLSIVLNEGRNRHIRRLLSALGLEVLRLVRISIGSLVLGNLPKGRFRHLTPEEVRSLERQSPGTTSPIRNNC